MRTDFGRIHTKCADERRNLWQANNAKTILKNGDLIQVGVGLVDSEIVEHLWFKIIGVMGTKVSAELISRPVYLPMKKGDILDVDRTDIEDHC